MIYTMSYDTDHQETAVYTFTSKPDLIIEVSFNFSLNLCVTKIKTLLCIGIKIFIYKTLTRSCLTIFVPLFCTTLYVV